MKDELLNAIFIWFSDPLALFFLSLYVSLFFPNNALIVFPETNNESLFLMCRTTSARVLRILKLVHKINLDSKYRKFPPLFQSPYIPSCTRIILDCEWEKKSHLLHSYGEFGENTLWKKKLIFHNTTIKERKKKKRVCVRKQNANLLA